MIQIINGVNAVDVDANATRGQIASGDHKGMPTTGAVTVSNQGAAASFIAASLDYRKA